MSKLRNTQNYETLMANKNLYNRMRTCDTIFSVYTSFRMELLKTLVMKWNLTASTNAFSFLATFSTSSLCSDWLHKMISLV